MAECPEVCEHLHLPAQSGSTRVLKAMRRTYSRERYLELVARLRDAIPDLSLTTDLIVGFPGETEEDFADDALAGRGVPATTAPTPSSTRRGPAPRPHERLPDDVPPEVKRERIGRLVEVVQRTAAARAARFVGTTREVLVEGPSRTDASRLRGRLRQNIAVNFTGAAAPGALTDGDHRRLHLDDPLRAPGRRRRGGGRSRLSVSWRWPGPTAAGKSALAHAAARALGGEIVVADPFQRYRGLEIAADSPRPPSAAEVRHHGVGDLDADRALDRRRLRRAAPTRPSTPAPRPGGRRSSRGAPASTCAPRWPTWASRPSRRPEARDWAERLAERRPRGGARGAARARPRRGRGRRPGQPAPAGAGPAGGRRRAAAAARRPLDGADAPSDPAGRRRRARARCSTARIAERVRRELDEGLVAELEAALDTPGVSREALQVIGAREVAAMRAGELDAADLPDRLAARTRRLARKQLTWLRRTPGVAELDLGDAPAEEALPRLLALWRGSDGRSGNLRGMRFAKWQGLGNDYLIVERAAWPLALTPARARLLCDPQLRRRRRRHPRAVRRGAARRG